MTTGGCRLTSRTCLLNTCSVAPPADPNWGDDWEGFGFRLGVVALGGCGCGAVGCNPLVVSIEVSDGIVRWRDFQSSEVRRLDLGPFVFNFPTNSLQPAWGS